VACHCFSGACPQCVTVTGIGSNEEYGFFAQDWHSIAQGLHMHNRQKAFKYGNSDFVMQSTKK
jgi:hypothetical protein